MAISHGYFGDPPREESALGGIICQLERRQVGAPGLATAPEPPEQVGLGSWQIAVTVEPAVGLELGDVVKRGLRPADHGDDYGSGEFDHRRRPDAEQPV